MTPRLLLAALVSAIGGKGDRIQPAPRPPDEHEFWARELQEVQAELRARIDAGLATDAAELAEGLSCALSFVPALVVKTQTERDRLLTQVRTPGHELTVMYLTGVHHSSVASTLTKAIELA
jgi:hypothetical protein